MIDEFAHASGFASDSTRRTLVRLACDYAAELQTDADEDTELACAWAIDAARRFVDDDCLLSELLCAIDAAEEAMNLRTEKPMAVRSAHACASAALDYYLQRSTVALVDVAQMLGAWSGDISIAQRRIGA